MSIKYWQSISLCRRKYSDFWIVQTVTIHRSLGTNIRCKATIIASDVLGVLCQIVIACMLSTLLSEFLTRTSDPSILYSPCSGDMRTDYAAGIVGTHHKCIRAMHRYRASLSFCFVPEQLTYVRFQYNHSQPLIFLIDDRLCTFVLSPSARPPPALWVLRHPFPSATDLTLNADDL